MWTFDKYMDTWLYGSSNNGCGVFFEEGKWRANIVYGDVILFIDDNNNIDDAKEKAVAQLNKLREEL